MAAAGMALGWLLLLLWQGLGWASLLVGLLLACIAFWLWRRPEPRAEHPPIP